MTLSDMLFRSADTNISGKSRWIVDEKDLASVHVLTGVQELLKHVLAQPW
jgi:hypothetical protein